MSAELRKIDCEPLGGGIEERMAELREMIDAGTVSSIAFVVVHRDGTTGCGFSDLPSTNMMLAGVSRLQYRLAKRLEE